MCTFNIAIDDQLVTSARLAFRDEKSMTAWIEEQITVLLNNHVNNAERRPRKHDALMGILSDAPDTDYRRSHLREKYGI